MRQFIVLGHEAPTTPDFSLDDLAGGAGRLDALCRCVNSAFFLSHAVRDDVRCTLVHQDEVAIRFEGSELRRLNPDERSTAALVRKALEHRDEAIGALPAEPSPGVELYRRGFADTLEEIADDGPIVQLHEDGEAVVDVGAERLADAVFVLSDHRDFTDPEADVLEESADQRLRLGPQLLHADQAITVAHHYLDTDGYERF